MIGQVSPSPKRRLVIECPQCCRVRSGSFRCRWAANGPSFTRLPKGGFQVRVATGATAGIAWGADTPALMDRDFCSFFSVAPHLMRGLASFGAFVIGKSRRRLAKPRVKHGATSGCWGWRCVRPQAVSEHPQRGRVWNPRYAQANPHQLACWRIVAVGRSLRNG